MYMYIYHMVCTTCVCALVCIHAFMMYTLMEETPCIFEFICHDFSYHDFTCHDVMCFLS